MEANTVKIIEGEIIKDAIAEYYTVVHTYDGYGWYATGIMTDSKEKAFQQFGTWAGVKEFRLIKIDLPILINVKPE